MNKVLLKWPKWVTAGPLICGWLTVSDGTDCTAGTAVTIPDDLPVQRYRVVSMPHWLPAPLWQYVMTTCPHSGTVPSACRTDCRHCCDNTSWRPARTAVPWRQHALTDGTVQVTWRVIIKSPTRHTEAPLLLNQGLFSIIATDWNDPSVPQVRSFQTGALRNVSHSGSVTARWWALTHSHPGLCRLTLTESCRPRWC